MKHLQINIAVGAEHYLKNPESTELGKRIVSNSIGLMDALGFESFTFKKLGVEIHSNESSIYRYFESKHSLLVYLISWYWSWIEYKMVFATMNVEDPLDRLMRCITILTEHVVEDTSISYINEAVLHKIIVAESSKAYHTKDIDKENEKGYYKTYKKVVNRVSAIVNEINPSFEFPQMLISTVIEGAHHQRYFSEHLPSLTNVEKGKNNIVTFYKHLVVKTIQ